MRGEIAPSDTAIGRLGAASCSFTDSSFSENEVYYDSYTFRATAGKAYQLTARAPEGDADYVLELWGSGAAPGEEQLLAVDDEGGGGVGGNDPQLIFVAPQSGAYSLRVMGLTAGDTSTYVLTARECPVHGVITTTFSSANEMLEPTDCVWSQPAFNGFLGAGNSIDSSRVALYTVHMDANTQRRIIVVSHHFAPGFYVAGPGFDAVCRAEPTCHSLTHLAVNGVDSTASIFTAPVSGEYTLAIGARAYTLTGTFELIVDAAEAALRVASPHRPSPRALASSPYVRAPRTGRVAGHREARYSRYGAP